MWRGSVATAADVIKQAKWLAANPEFEECPATIIEFLLDDYLNIYDKVRPAIREELRNIFGNKVDNKRIAQVADAIFTGAIGIGKTTVASIVLPYMCHWVLCLKDPQDYFNLLPGSRIAFMMMSTSEDQAKQVLFGDIDARLRYSPWFRTHAERDPNFKNQIRFPAKDIWILPGDSKDTTFEGYNILGGIIDEADSHLVTEEKDYAESGYNTIHARIESRFGDRGFLLVIGQMKKATGFAKKRYDICLKKPNAYAAKLTIWESFGWERYMKDGKRDSFWYDIKRKQIIPAGVVQHINNANLIEIPKLYEDDFINDPEKALRDLAGIPPAVGDPFISLVDRIELCRDKWIERFGPESPVVDNPSRPSFIKGFKAHDNLKRAVHIDMAYSAKGDALGMAMGHVREVVEINSELKPYIVFDCLIRIKAAAGSEIFLQDVRNLIYYMHQDLGFRIKNVTTDGFQSTDTQQQLRKKRYFVDEVSVDKNKLPYSDLREAIYEQRVEFPPYIVTLYPGKSEKVEIAVKELSELQDMGLKIDHPPEGSKDVADAMAGVTYTLMGDRSYSRRSHDLGDFTSEKQDSQQQSPYGGIHHPAVGRMSDLSAPIPPSGDLSRWGLLQR